MTLVPDLPGSPIRASHFCRISKGTPSGKGRTRLLMRNLLESAMHSGRISQGS